MKQYLTKLKEVTINTLPIIILVVAVHFIVKPMPANYFWLFIIGGGVIIVGQTLFLIGVEKSIVIMGELIGSKIKKLKTLPMIMLFGFLFGTVATVAEPAVQVLVQDVAQISSTSATLLVWLVGVGIGIGIAFALFRLFKSLSIKWFFIVGYSVALVLLFVTPAEYVPLSLDFSGATTGAITVPFILAFGVGITASFGGKSKEEGFGLIGLSSIGPIIVIVIMGIILGKNSGTSIPPSESVDVASLLFSNLKNTLIALAPIALIFVVFNLIFIKLSKRKFFNIIFGLLISFIGLAIFLWAVDFSFYHAGRHIGEAFTDNSAGNISWLLVPLGALLGAGLAYTEPSVIILADQVKEITGGQIKPKFIVNTLALSMAFTTALGMVRLLANISILWFIAPIIVLSLILSLFAPKMFVGLAFDSGGAASGTVASAFLVPLMLGACSGLGRTNLLLDGFGMVAFISLMPLLVMQVFGVMYQMKINRLQKMNVKNEKQELEELAKILKEGRKKTNGKK